MRIVIVVMLLIAQAAFACGVTAPLGPTGLPQLCNSDEVAEGEVAVKHRVGVAAGGARTTLLIGQPMLLEQISALASFEFRQTPRLTWQFAAGALVAGRMSSALGDVVSNIGPGALLGAGVSYTLVEPKGAVPFVMVSGAFSATLAGLQPADRYGALDLRAGVLAGWTLFKLVSPYVVARAFGGPAFWRGQVGGDLYHYQFGAGLVAALPGNFDLTFEAVPLGELRISGGIGYSF